MLAPQSEDFVQIVDADGASWLRRSSVIAVETRDAHHRYALRVDLGVNSIHFVFADMAARTKAISLIINAPIPI